MSNLTTTENGATTNISSLNNIVDFFYHAPAKRGQEKEIQDLFTNAINDDVISAVQAMFYLRDPRGGQGERSSFRTCLSKLSVDRPIVFDTILPLVPFYGRWDDILLFTTNPQVQYLVQTQFTNDLNAVDTKTSVSLLAKWLPSINTSSKETKALGRKWAKILGLTERNYRKSLSKIRTYIDIVESKMSSNEWSKINYSTVPSRASMLYRNAFWKHDSERYSDFVQKAVKGEVKINSSVLYPYDIVNKYGFSQGDYNGTTSDDLTLEALWKQLPNYSNTEKNALVVADVSGSMSGTPMCVCLSLAIYIAERNKGPFKDMFVTFSSQPSIQTLIGNSLREKLTNLSQADWDMSTNIDAVFDLILNVAQESSANTDQIPEMIFIVSDMEFDSCVYDGNGLEKSNYEWAKTKFEASGYKLPKVVFWNVASRGKQTPVTINDTGTYLVSGCSPSIFERAINADAMNSSDLVMEVLNGERYGKIRELLTPLVG